MAVETLSSNGYRIIERNYRNFFGEIDIIAEEGGYLVFVEVKKRNSSIIRGLPPRNRQEETAAYDPLRHVLLKDHKCFDRKVRFDVVGIDRENLKIVKYAFMVELGF